jgi:putative MFS transporter
VAAADAPPHTGITAASLGARLDRLPATRAVWKLIALLSLGFFFEVYDLLFTAYVAPALVQEGILTPTTAGLFGTTGVAGFVASLFLGLFLATIAGGVLADKFGRRAIFTYSLLWAAAANAIMACQSTAFGLNFWRFVAGLGIGVELITIGTYLTELAPKQIRGRAFAFCQAIGFAAVPTVSLLAYWLVPLSPLGISGWRWTVAIGSGAAVCVWWIRRQLPESPRWLAQHGRLQEADAVVSSLEQRVERECGYPLPPVRECPVPAQSRSFRDMWAPPYRRRTIMMSVFNVFQTVGYYGFASWVPTLLIAQGIDVTSSLLYTSIIALAAPIGPLIGLGIADRFERKHVIVTMALTNVVCGLLFSQVRHPALIIAMGVCLTLAGNIISYSYHLYQQELFPTGIRSRAAGFVYSWSRFSAIFSPFVIAYFLQHFGVTGVFLFIGAAMSVVVAVIGLMGPRTRGAALESISH